jgi:lipid-A-disaccharide synthase
MDREVVKELLQFHLARDIKNELDKILFNKEYRQEMLKNFEELSDKVGKPGASTRAARSMFQFITKN